MNDLLECFKHVLILVREKMLMPKHIEQWVLIVNSPQSNHQNILNTFSKEVSNNFPMSLAKVIIVIPEVDGSESLSLTPNRKLLVY